MSELIKKYDHTIDVLKNSIRNVKLNPISTTERLKLVLTTVDEGFICYDTTLNKIYTWNGIAWDTCQDGITDDIVADLKVGAVNAGQLIQAPKNLQEFAELLLNTSFYPDFIYPSASMSTSVGGNTVEVGAPIQLSLYLNYDFGQIRGAVTSTFPHVWDANLKQNNKSGSILYYIMNNISIGLSNTKLINGYVPVLGYNSFNGYVGYNTGPQPLDSKGLDYSTKLQSGVTATVSTGFFANYKQFFGDVIIYPITSDGVRSLGSSNFADTNTFESYITDTAYTLAIPESKQVISIISGSNESIFNRFTLSTAITMVNDGAGTPVRYKVYNYHGDQSLRLKITIKLM